MIIIDEKADMKLAEALEALRADPGISRCIHFHLSHLAVAQGIREQAIAAAKRHTVPGSARIFFCEDGDIFILAPVLPGKKGKELILEMAAFLNMPPEGEWASFYELEIQINKLLVIVEQKIERRRLREELGRKQREEEQAKRRRQAILEGGLRMDGEYIRKRRAVRDNPELMIIEDDAFSRKLVENVLHKQYRLTALATADHALSTYTSLAPDTLFLDINLPDVTGHELLEKIIAIDPDAYVIMLSGNSDKANVMQAINLGAKGFIAKPFTRDKLIQYIERCQTINREKSHAYL